MEVRRLLKKGQAHKQELPKTLFIPSNQPAKKSGTFPSFFCSSKVRLLTAAECTIMQ